MVAGVIYGGGERHGGGGEVLHLFEFEVEGFGFGCEFRHVFGAASGVGGDEVGDDLLVEVVAAVEVVELLFECFEEVEGGFAHESEDAVGDVFGGDFEASGGVAENDGFEVGAVAGVGFRVAARVKAEVVAYAGADEAVLDAGDAVCGGIQVEEGAVVGVEVFADGGVGAGRPSAEPAEVEVASLHAVHVGGGTAEVGDGAPEVGHFTDGPQFPEDGFGRAGDDEFALVGGDGAEGASSEAAAMKGDGVAYHAVGGDFFAAVARMGQACEREGVNGIEFAGGHGGIGGIDDDLPLADGLDEAGGFHAVGFFLDAAEVFGVAPFVAEALFMGVEGDGLPFFVACDGGVPGAQDSGLGEVGEVFEGDSAAEHAAEFFEGLLAHAVDEHVGAAACKDGGAGGVLPVVVVGEPPQGGFDAADDDGGVGKELFEDAGVNQGGHVRAGSRPAVGGVGVIRTAPAGGGVMIDHGVHDACRNAEKEARASQFLEVPEVILPIGLGDDGDPQALGFEYPADDRRPEGGVVDVGVACEEDDVKGVPAPFLYLFGGGRQPLFCFHIPVR